MNAFSDSVATPKIVPPLLVVALTRATDAIDAAAISVSAKADLPLDLTDPIDAELANADLAVGKVVWPVATPANNFDPVKPPAVTVRMLPLVRTCELRIAPATVREFKAKVRPVARCH